MQRMSLARPALYGAAGFGASRRSAVPIVLAVALAAIAAVPAAGQTAVNFEQLRPSAPTESFLPPATSGGASSGRWFQGTEAFVGPMEPPEPSGFGETATRKPADWLPQAPASPRRNWIRRHPALFGALVGAGAGAISSATMENELFCSGGDEDCLIYGGGRVLVGAGIGAGIGALAGWLVSLGSR